MAVCTIGAGTFDARRVIVPPLRRKALILLKSRPGRYLGRCEGDAAHDAACEKRGALDGGDPRFDPSNHRRGRTGEPIERGRDAATLAPGAGNAGRADAERAGRIARAEQ